MKSCRFPGLSYLCALSRAPGFHSGPCIAAIITTITIIIPETATVADTMGGR